MKRCPVGWMVLALAGLEVLGSGAAQARPVSPWRISDLVAKSEVIVVGEVTQITEVGKIAPEDTKWKTPLLQMSATVRVVRAAGRGGIVPPRKDSLVEIPFQSVDWASGGVVVNGPIFPELRVGEVLAFPLRHPSDAKAEGWEMIGDEDFALLVPCAAVTRGGIGTGELTSDSLITELAGAFVHGDDATLVRAATYAREFIYDPDGVIPRVADATARDLPKGDSRWLTVAAFSYCASGVPRPTLTEMLQSEGKDTRAGLTARALQQADQKDLRGRFLQEVLRCAAVSNTTLWGAGGAIYDNYLHDPELHASLAKGLEADRPECIYLTEIVVRNLGAAQPERRALLTKALPTAKRYLTRVRSYGTPPQEAESSARQVFQAAVLLLRDYGSRKERDWLVGEFRRAQSEDRARYAAIWDGVNASDSLRMVPFLRVAISDEQAASRAYRYREVAAFAALHLASVGPHAPFPFDPAKATPEEVVRWAKEWLSKQKD